MPTGNLAGGTLTGTLTSFYTCPASTVAFVTVNIVNPTASPITVRICLSTNASENLGGYIEFDSTIAANQALEKTGIVVKATEQILLRSSSTSAIYRIFGYERAN